MIFRHLFCLLLPMMWISISEEQINSGKPIEINMTGSGFDGMNKLSFTLVEYDPTANVTHKYLKELGSFDPSDSPYFKRVFMA